MGRSTGTRSIEEVTSGLSLLCSRRNGSGYYPSDRRGDGGEEKLESRELSTKGSSRFISRLVVQVMDPVQIFLLLHVPEQKRP